MQSCVYCNAPLQPGQTFCGACGRAQPQGSFDSQATMMSAGGAMQPAPASQGTFYPPANQPAGSPPRAFGDSQATQFGSPGLPPPPPQAASGLSYAPPSENWGPTQANTSAVPSNPYGPTQAGTPAAPSGPWSSPQGGIGNVPVAPGWQATGSQQTVGWQPSGSQPWQQPGGSQPWQQGPGSQPWQQQPPVMPPPGAAGGKRNGRKIGIIVGGILAAIILIAAAGGLFYILTQPNPSITITSATSKGSTPTGSPDKSLHITGQKFSHNEAITLLLDGKKAPGAPGIHSDGNGAFATDLTITDDWLVGTHQITARDTSNYVTKTAAQVEIVPAPVINVDSQYQSGSTPAGAAGTSFHVTGKRFPLNAPVTFMLDGKPVPGASSVQSDAHGMVDTDFSVNGNWTIGNHTLTAQDSQGDTTQQSAPLVVVHPGEAGTPGPNGSPANNATFNVSYSVTAKTTANETVSYSDQLQITGQPDPAGGKVCGVNDDGKSHTYTGTISGTSVSYTETIVYQCSGSYKNGHLSYTETATSDKFTLSDGSVCVSSGSYVYTQLDGSFTDQSNLSGTYHRDYFQANCNAGSQYSSIYRNAASGTWQGSKF